VRVGPGWETPRRVGLYPAPVPVLLDEPPSLARYLLATPEAAPERVTRTRVSGAERAQLAERVARMRAAGQTWPAVTGELGISRVFARRLLDEAMGVAEPPPTRKR
jgi:hypothetical protein